jgi:acetolactate synthase regulatory subunit
MSSGSAAPLQDAVGVRFMLDADADPGLLSRLLQPFARRDLVPDRMWSHRNGQIVHVEIAVAAVPLEIVHLIEGNLRQIVGVHRVTQLRSSGLQQAA